MKIKYSILLVGGAAMMLLSSCNIYRNYTRPSEVTTAGMYRDTLSSSDTLRGDTISMGNLPWQEVFRDPYLQTLIAQGLEHNIDLQTAYLRVQSAHASLQAARLAYVPSFNLNPSGGLSWYENGRRSWTYQVPATASWELDIFGRLLNSKRGARAALMQSEAYAQAVRTQVIAAIANAYYTLQMLNQQLAISEQTVASWYKSVETMKALKLAGNTNEAAVVQSEANCHSIEASLPDLRQSIRETENALSILLGVAPQAIECPGTLAEQALPSTLSAGVPAQMLSNRPDVQAAEAALMSAYAATNVARAAFYPGLSITGTAGWTNSLGSVVVNPGKLIANAAASLLVPIFNQGRNRAQLRAAQAQQEESMLAFQQTILNAGSEVSNALYQYKAAQDKSTARKAQILALERSVDYTQQLLKLGSSTYLEVLTAQQSLLSAQLTQVSDDYQKMQAVVSLYQALGGGRDMNVKIGSKETEKAIKAEGKAFRKEFREKYNK